MSRKAIPMIGRRFGMLTVLARVDNYPGNHWIPRYLCVCDCGQRCIVKGGSLRRELARKTHNWCERQRKQREADNG